MILTQILAFIPNALWFVGSWLAGRPFPRRGWALLFASEAAWVVLAARTHLWTILPWCAAGFVVYAKNFRTARRVEI